MDAAEQAGHVLDALALVECRLDGRDADLTYLLDQTEGSHRAIAVVLADALAQVLTGEFGNEAGEALAQLRERVLGGGTPGD
jgi:hypothetical protein